MHKEPDAQRHTTSFHNQQTLRDTAYVLPHTTHKRPKVHFRGQQPTEQTIFIQRKHWWYLVRGLTSSIAVVVVWVFFLGLEQQNANLTSYSLLISSLMLGLLIISLLLWFFQTLLRWYFECFILTDRRIIDVKGIIYQVRKEAVLDKIQEVGAEVKNLLEEYLKYGTVSMKTAGPGGTIEFVGIAYPSEVQRLVNEKIADYKKATAPPVPEIVAKNTAMAQLIAQLSNPDPGPRLTGTEKKRIFKPPFSVNPVFKYQKDEEVLMYVQKHWYILLQKEYIPILFILILVILFAVFHIFFWQIFIAVILVGGCVAVVRYIDWKDDLYIFTTERIIDIDRFYYLFVRQSITVELQNIQNVTARVPSLLARILNYGTVFIETAAHVPDLVLLHVPDPFFLQNNIAGWIELQRQRETMQDQSRVRSELKHWFTQIANQLYRDSVPDLIGLDYAEASRIIYQLGLKVKVQGDQSHPTLPVGAIVSQQPPPGGMMVEGGLVEVIISSGPQVRKMPKVIGLPFGRAEQILIAEGFKIEQVRVPRRVRSRPNSIIEQEPAPGTNALVGSIVKLMVTEDES